MDFGLAPAHLQHQRSLSGSPSWCPHCNGTFPCMLVVFGRLRILVLAVQELPGSNPSPQTRRLDHCGDLTEPAQDWLAAGLGGGRSHTLRFWHLLGRAVW